MGKTGKLIGLSIGMKLVHALLFEPLLGVEAILVPLLVVHLLLLGHLLLVVGDVVVGKTGELERLGLLHQLLLPGLLRPFSSSGL